MTPRTPSRVVNPKRAAVAKNNLPMGEFDVHCGKGRSNFGHMGNKRFQAIIALNIPRYRRAGKKRGIKSDIVKAVLKDVRSLGSRFFQKKGEDWIQVINERIICDKVGHALRDSFCSKDTYGRAEAFMNMNGFEYDNFDHYSDNAAFISAVPIAPFIAADDDDDDIIPIESYDALLVSENPFDMLRHFILPEISPLRRQSPCVEIASRSTLCFLVS